MEFITQRTKDEITKLDKKYAVPNYIKKLSGYIAIISISLLFGLVLCTDFAKLINYLFCEKKSLRKMQDIKPMDKKTVKIKPIYIS